MYYFYYMSRNYKFHDQEQAYFVTFTTVGWVDVFTRDVYREIMLDSMKYCIDNKGLVVYAWVIMTNHVHLIMGTSNKPMYDILRDLKSYTSRHIRKALESNQQESRKEWMKYLFTRAGFENNNNYDWQLWQQHNHPIELNTAELAEQRLNYLHENPVRSGFVSRPEDYLWSSARNYCGEQGLLDVVFLM